MGAPFCWLPATVLLVGLSFGCGKPAAVAEPEPVADFFRDPADAAPLQPWKVIADSEQVPPDWIIRRDDTYDSISALVSLPNGGEWSVELEFGTISTLFRDEILQWGLNSAVEPRYKAMRTLTGELWIDCDLAQSGLSESWAASLRRRQAPESDEQILQEILPRRSALFRQILAMKSE